MRTLPTLLLVFWLLASTSSSTLATRCAASPSAIASDRSGTDPAGQGHVPSGATVAVVPGTLSTRPSESITVAVDMDGAADLGAFQFDLVFDPTVLHVEDVLLAGLLGSTGRTAAPLGPEIDNTAGSASFGGFTFGSQPGPDGHGTLATITLAARGVGSSWLVLRGVQIVDAQGQIQNVLVSSGRVLVGLSECLWLPLAL